MKLWLHRTYLDLSEPPSQGYLTCWGAELAARSFFENRQVPRFRGFNVGFRARLVAELGCEEVSLFDPREVAGPRSERWDQLCAGLNQIDNMSLIAFDRLLWLLHSLGFDRLIEQMISKRPLTSSEVLLETGSSVIFTRALAQYSVGLESTGRPDPAPFEEIWSHCLTGSVSRAHASYYLCQVEAKTHKRVEVLEALLHRHEADVREAATQLPAFDANWLWARFHRVHAFLPQFLGRLDQMVDEMMRADEESHGLPSDDDEYHLAKRELIWPVNESWIKAHIVRGDLISAEIHARKLVEDTPLQARAALNLAEVLMMQERFEEARMEFRRVYRLGPPGTEIAAFYLAQFAEEEGDIETATDYYLEALRIDPFSTSALEGLRNLGTACVPDDAIRTFEQRQDQAREM